MTILLDNDLELDVTGGTIRGIELADLHHWRAIPYAAPPTGDRRLRAPQPVEPWEGVRDASAFGPVSHQVAGLTRVPMSEDCLTLNVIAPRTPGVARPVMVFIHGGAYTTGSSREIPHLGEALVREGDVVFVNFNYRLGALGYLDFSEFSTPERPLDINLGLRDQVAALEWVRDNIARFGGDPDNVTVFGESAGGNAVTTLLAVPVQRACSRVRSPRARRRRPCTRARSRASGAPTTSRSCARSRGMRRPPRPSCCCRPPPPSSCARPRSCGSARRTRSPAPSPSRP